MMEVLHSLIKERNAIETTPFVAVYESNVRLNSLVRKLETRCQQLDFECSTQRNKIHTLGDQVQSRGPSKGELKQKEKVEQLQQKLGEKERIEHELMEGKKSISQDLVTQMDLHKEQEKSIDIIKEEIKQKDVVVERITEELRDTTSRLSLAEKQYDGLKENIRRLQEENETLTKSNDDLVNRLVKDKEKYMEEMVNMTDMYEKANQKIAMLMKLQEQEKKRFLWGKSKKSSNADLSEDQDKKAMGGRQFGAAGVVLPSSIKCKVMAHPSQVICVRYDAAGGDVVATASEDSTVKIWHTGNGQLLKTLRGSSGQVMLGLDMSGDIAAGCGSDKTCRIWNVRTQRLVHQIVGHSQKVNCVRMLHGNKSIITASADRSMKVWDISRSTYRQTVTLRHSSTSNSLDTSYDGVSAVSGHLDGGVRFWDVRSGDRTGDVTELHGGGVTSVNFNPSNNGEILTCGRDSSLKLVDVRKNGQEMQTFYHSEFRVDLSYAKAAISPDGKYAAAGSSTGDVFIWRTSDGNLEKQLKGHEAGVVAVAWDRGGSNGQQFSSIDRKGNLFLWA